MTLGMSNFNRFCFQTPQNDNLAKKLTSSEVCMYNVQAYMHEHVVIKFKWIKFYNKFEMYVNR